jgi:hypothetical protein
MRPRTLRLISAGTVLCLLLAASPLPVLAETSWASPAENARVAPVLETVRRDLATLAASGKEAYLDSLFERLAKDEATVKKAIQETVHKTGARRICMLILGLGSPVLAGVLAVLPRSWQESLVVGCLNRFVAKTVKAMKSLISTMSKSSIETGLRAVERLLGQPSGAASALRAPGQSRWERFFSDSKTVRNMLIVFVTVSAMGVAIGLAIAGSTAAPVVAVIGALVSLIALLTP